jgi:hypothetical protein
MSGSSKYTVAGPAPQIDDHRKFHGRPQLSRRDLRILESGQCEGIRVSHEKGETVFYCGVWKLPRQAVTRLQDLGYLIPAEGGLFDGMGQTLLVNTVA